MKAPSGYILLKGERYNETFTTPGGLVMYRYLQEGNETKDVNYWGEVVAIPDDAGQIVPEVEVGDKAYVHFNSFLKDHNFVVTDQGNFWKVAYEDVICVVRGEEIVPIGGWCLIEPELKKVDTGSFVTSVVLEDGTVLGEDIIIKSETKGTLAHIGTPRKNWEVQNPAPKVGDKVAFSEYDAFENTIEGKEYYCMGQNRILGVYG